MERSDLLFSSTARPVLLKESSSVAQVSITNVESITIKERPIILWPSSLVIVQELCESRGGRLGLSVLTSLLVSVGVKLY